MSLFERIRPSAERQIYVVAAAKISPESFYTVFRDKKVVRPDWSEIAVPSARFKLVGRWDRGKFIRTDLDGNNRKVGESVLPFDIAGLKSEAVVHSDGRMFLNVELIEQFGEDNQPALDGFCQKLVDDIINENGGFGSSKAA